MSVYAIARARGRSEWEETDLPYALDVGHRRLAAHDTLGSDLQGHTRDLACQSRETGHHLVDGRLQVEHLTLHVDVDRPAQVSVGDSLRDLGDRPHLVRQIHGHFLQRAVCMSASD